MSVHPEGARADVEVVAAPLLMQESQVMLTDGEGVPSHEPALIASGVPTTGDAPITGSDEMLALEGLTIVTFPLTDVAGK